VVNRYEAVAVTTRYWRPGEDYHRQIVKAIENKVEDKDFVAISEKAISTALGNIVDESAVQSSRFARFLAKYWIRFVWSYVLGLLCHLRKRTIRRLRAYPIEEGSAHKQVALEHGGFLQALMQGSEGAIDGSNLPYSYVSLPLKNAQQIAQKIRKQIEYKLDKKVTVVIVDTDKTYSLKGFHFTPHPDPLKGIYSFGGFLAYVAGRFFKLEKRATPLAVAGSRIATEEAIEIAKIANRSRGSGAGRTVWDMAKTFRVPLTGVTWEMLDEIKHQPIVIIRPKRE
jgi:F420-0:gamma-glutamyl ligase-like protein